MVTPPPPLVPRWGYEFVCTSQCQMGKGKGEFAQKPPFNLIPVRQATVSPPGSYSTELVTSEKQYQYPSGPTTGGGPEKGFPRCLTDRLNQE